MNALQKSPYPIDVRHAVAASSGDEARKRIEDAAVKFEGMFVAHLLGEMRRINEEFAPEDAGGGRREDAGLLDHAYRLVADDIARQRAFGIADAIVAQMAPQDRALPRSK